MASDQHHIFLALSNPRAGREEEFDRWYDADHLQDVVDLAPGFTRGRRYLPADRSDDADRPLWTSLAVYNLDSRDVAALHREVKVAAPSFTPSNGVFEDDHVAWVFTPAGQAVATDDWTLAPHGAGIPPRLLALALGTDPIATDAVGRIEGVMRGHRFARHADQRPGVDLPWDHLTLFELDARRPDAVGALAAATGANLLWVYRPVGVEHASTPRTPNAA